MADLVEASSIICEMKRTKPMILFPKPRHTTIITICTIYDAFHNGMTETYGHSGVLCGLKVRTESLTLYHPVMWSSHIQKKVSYSSFGAEILAAADGDDRGYHVKMTLGSLFPEAPVRHHMMLGSKSLFETITTLHYTGDYRLRKVVSRMRDPFDSKELNAVTWISVSENLADALSKKKLGYVEASE